MYPMLIHLVDKVGFISSAPQVLRLIIIDYGRL